MNRQYVLLAEFGRLWRSLAEWTRNYIVSCTGNLPDIEAVSARLYRVPYEFETRLTPFYGAVQAESFRRLLDAQIGLTQELCEAVKAGDLNSVARINDELYRNADSLSRLCECLNLCWNAAKWRCMLHEFLRLTENMLIERAAGRYAAEIETYDALLRQASLMGDYMACGIIRQFNIK